MTHPGERRPSASTPAPPTTRPPVGVDRLRPQRLPAAVAEAAVVALISALAWAFVHGVLEFPGALVVAVIGGWLVGEVLWSVQAHPAIAGIMAVLAWAVGLVFTWLMAMALLPSSSRTFLERVEGTPFLDWLAPQFGTIEVAGLVLYVVAALFGARPRSS